MQGKTDPQTYNTHQKDARFHEHISRKIEETKHKKNFYSKMVNHTKDFTLIRPIIIWVTREKVGLFSFIVRKALKEEGNLWWNHTRWQTLKRRISWSSIKRKELGRISWISLTWYCFHHSWTSIAWINIHRSTNFFKHKVPTTLWQTRYDKNDKSQHVHMRVKHHMIYYDDGWEQKKDKNLITLIIPWQELYVILRKNSFLLRILLPHKTSSYQTTQYSQDNTSYHVYSSIPPHVPPIKQPSPKHTHHLNFLHNLDFEIIKLIS